MLGEESNLCSDLEVGVVERASSGIEGRNEFEGKPRAAAAADVDRGGSGGGGGDIKEEVEEAEEKIGAFGRNGGRQEDDDDADVEKGKGDAKPKLLGDTRGEAGT